MTTLVARRRRDRGDVRVGACDPGGEGRCGWIGGAGIVIQVLVESEDTAAEDVHRVMRQVDREATVADDLVTASM